MEMEANAPWAGRRERRISAKVLVEITDWRQAAVSEQTFTENLSVHGARLTSRWHWSQGELVLIALHPQDVRALARTVYCEPTAGDAYVVGVQIIQSPDEWWKE